jgi:CBS domain-containing protein
MNSKTPDSVGGTELTHARDVMTTNVISVSPDMPIKEIAALLLDKRVSAVPVVNDDGVPIGMVSEGDLVERGERQRLARRDWWLEIISGSQALDDKFAARLQAYDRAASDIMAAPLVTVTEDTPVNEIARLLAIHHIKRVPVVRDGHLVGIVGRADLLRVVARGQADTAEPKEKEHRSFLANLFGEYHLPVYETVVGNRPPEETPERDASKLTADELRHLVEDFHHGEAQHADETRPAAAKRRRERARELIDAHVFNQGWREIMQRACEAAENGQKELLLLRFPSQLCIDGGRAINVAEQTWSATLRGRPAELYLRWERDLKPRGFSLSARVLDFPDGKPGDVGLFLGWAA